MSVEQAMEPEQSVEIGKKKEPQEAKLLLHRSAGLVYTFNSADIDDYLKKKKLAFEKSCTEHSKVLQDFHNLMAHQWEDLFPEDIVKTITECYGNENPSSLIGHASDELKKQIADADIRVERSEKEHGIGYPDTPENMFFAYVDSSFITHKSPWNNFEGVQAAFKKEDREFVVEYFFDSASRFVKTVYHSEIERMMSEQLIKTWDLRYALRKEPVPFTEPIVQDKKTEENVQTKPKEDFSADDKNDESNEKEVKLSKSKSKTKSCCIS